MSSLNYKPPFFLFNAHLETIFPSQFRNVKLRPYTRERIVTPDHDFLDLDWLKQQSEKLVIISHGLEGDTTRPYVKGMAKAFYENGYDVLTWNYRGCSGEMNKTLGFYHSGATADLATVADYAARQGYAEIDLIGFSLGGNMTLKYLGESRVRPEQLKRAVTISVPLDLYSSCVKISQPSNWVYSRRFLRSLRKKVVDKSKLMRELDASGINKVKTLHEFDDIFTGPIHGFKDALDYYSQSSSLKVVANIRIPTLIINAKNDPFLSPECYPEQLLSNHPFVTFESPQYGGHVGFTQFTKNGLYWSEERALRFLSR